MPGAQKEPIIFVGSIFEGEREGRDKNGRASRTTVRPIQLVDMFEANFSFAGRKVLQLSALVVKKQLPLHEVSRRTGYTRPFLRKQMRKLGIKNSHSRESYGPYGWDYSGKDLVVNVKEQKILFEILALHNSGLGCKSIAKKLNQQNLPAKAGKRWGHSSVQNILNRHKHEGN